MFTEMKGLLVFVAFAVIVTVIKGYSEDDRWKDYKVKGIMNFDLQLRKLDATMISIFYC